jgi:hypothetical protein
MDFDFFLMPVPLLWLSNSKGVSDGAAPSVPLNGFLRA